MINPFYYASEITNVEQIIGRDEISNEISLFLQSGNNVKLLGPRRIGKSTLLNKIEDDLSKYKWNFVKIDLSNSLSIIAFFRCILEGISGLENNNLFDKFQNELNIIEKNFGFNASIYNIGLNYNKKEIITPKEIEELSYQLLKSLVKIFTPIVVAFDEIQTLNQIQGGSYAPLTIIRKSLMSNNSIKNSVIMTGSIRRSMDMLLDTNSSPLSGQLETFELDRIQRTDWINYIKLNSTNKSKQFENHSIDYLLNLTNRHSQRTQQLAAQSWQSSKSNTITLNNIENAWKELSIKMDNEFDTRIRDMISNKEENLVRLLYAISENGYNNLTSENNLFKYGFNSKKNVTISKNKLINLGILESYNDEIFISDPLFSFWLKNNSVFN